jgi:hypothetical protein
METFESLNINKISKEFQEELDAKRLEVGQSVQFLFLDPKLNPDPEDRIKREFIWRQSDFIRGKETIKDPYSGKLVDIGVGEVDSDGKFIPAVLRVQLRDTNGYFIIVGGNTDQEKWYEFLLASNFNESNPHKNKNIKAKFKMIDVAKESKEKKKAQNTLREMLVLVDTLSKSERQEIASAYGWDRNSDDDTIITRLNEIVMKDAAGFAKVVGNKNDLSIKAILNEALSEGVITYAPLENKYTFAKTNEVICTLTRSESVESIDQLLEWAKTHNSGKAVMNNIKKLLKSSTTE